ncbi:MAG TPA: hypothetical protein VGJ15_01795, partial [Pirellulales bacterium]
MSPEPPRKFQFGLKRIFGVTTAVAVLAWVWPRGGDVRFQVFFAVQSALMVLMGVCASLGMDRIWETSEPDARRRNRQDFALTCGLAGMLESSIP